ncbi:Venom carboxylesterase-6 [Habropoda laboriosa]|uniref:Carboxylic ester hydrolase n=1 Tax=Habropoda laboriosa TaxID=597456 RepID=A0A0L7QZ14_9HYME|nr:Venom carboxylesterase-6 [Habropoda laboriosa]
MSKPTLLLLLFALVTLTWSLEEAPRVKTPLGPVKGYYKVSANGRQYEAYQGIPYALPPVGKLRFKPPQRISPWLGELAATKFGSPCLQYTQLPYDPSDRVEGAEDCLYLNIYVPAERKASSKPLPVIFWIHGGAFQFGSGMQMGAKYLMDGDVVLVTSNYRLGMLGFLSTEDEVVPGNMGLKDQSMALRWVSENIEWFGGDPNKVTLVGLSAGGASVHYHYLSPTSAGLFQGGISISGTAFDCWTQAENSLEKAKKLGALMGCPTNNIKNMVRCLRYRPSKTVVAALGEYMVSVLHDYSSDVPWVTGVTSEEGLYPVAEFIAKPEALKTLEENWELLAPHFLDYNYTLPKEKHIEVAKLIKNHYFGSKKIDSATLKPLIQVASDRFFVVDSEKVARMQAKVNKQPVWYYYYTYRGAQSLSDAMSGTTNNYGVSHADDAYFVVDTPYLNPTTTPTDIKMQRILIDFWVSFATDGVPNVGGAKWPRLNPSDKPLHYLRIAGPDKIHMESTTNFGEKDFWNSINFNENKLNTASGTLKEEL